MFLSSATPTPPSKRRDGKSLGPRFRGDERILGIAVAQASVRTAPAMNSTGASLPAGLGRLASDHGITGGEASDHAPQHPNRCHPGFRSTRKAETNTQRALILKLVNPRLGPGIQNRSMGQAPIPAHPRESGDPGVLVFLSFIHPRHPRPNVATEKAWVPAFAGMSGF